jgi:tetratricopeptide (TPR) repeat protein
MSGNLDRALLLYNQSRYELAEREVRQSLSDDPDHPVAHAVLAFCLAGRKQFDEARQEAERAVALAPWFPFVHYARAKVLYQQDRLPEAEDALAEAIRLDPGDPDQFALRASIQFDRRRWDDALASAEQGLAIDPDHVNCANLRAMALVKLGRKAEAGATIEGALAKDPENALTHANQGWTLLHQGDHKKALEHFREALRIDPELEWARVGIVEALKARHLLYRVMLRYFLWMSTLSRQVQWAVVLGILFGPRLLSSLAESVPAAAPAIIPLAVGLVGFAYLTWVADPLFNLLLRVNRFGRYALSRDQVVASNWVGACLVGGLVAAVAFVPLSRDLALIGLAYFALLILPLAATFRCPGGWRRWAMGLYTALVACVGLAWFGLLFAEMFGGSAAVRGLEGLSTRLVQAFVIGIVGSTWLAAGLRAN